MTSKQFKKGDVIFHEGDIGNTLYQINEGKVDIYLCYGESDQKLLTELTPGKFFGEMAVIEAYPRSATAVAMAAGRGHVADPSPVLDDLTILMIMHARHVGGIID